jgi:hypothetical protein
VLVDVSPQRVTATPGVPAIITVSVTNTGTVIAGYTVDVLGLDPAWVQVQGGPLSLFPGDAGTVTLLVELPADAPAGARRPIVQVRDLTRSDATSVTPVDIDVPARHLMTVALDPPVVSSGRDATVGLILENRGNGAEHVTLVGYDDDEEVRFAFDPPAQHLEVGERTVVRTRMRAKRPLTGSPKIRGIRVAAVLADGTRTETAGSLVQKPMLSRGVFALAGLLVAISVFAGVIATTFGRVAARSKADRNLLLDAISGDEEVAGAPGSIAGTVTSLTAGTPTAGVTVDAFPADDLTAAAATTATDQSGTFALRDLPAGTYKVRARGAGFIDVWFPLSLDPKAAQEVQVTEGNATPAIDLRVGGVPASLAGTVRGEGEVAGAAVNVRIPESAVPGGTGVDENGEPARGPIVASATVDASGQFEIPDIPSPATYEVTAELDGFAVQSQLINLAPAEERAGLAFNLRRGDGTISGHIRSADGPLGGAVITATEGTTSVRAVSLTRDDIGGYTLRDLPTPGTYTLVVTHDGYTTATLTVNLSARATRGGVDTTLTEGAGSIAGVVQEAGVGPAGGVLVRATDGEHVVQTVSVSVGTVGAYRLTGLAVPGTYTLSFERSDLAPQSRAVTLDRLSRRDVTGEDVSLTSASATISGTVRDTDDEPVGNVSVELSGNGITMKTTTATDPIGQYKLTRVPPGTYSLSFVRGGSAPTGLLVNVSAGQVITNLDAVLVARATLFGKVLTYNNNNPVELPSARVRLFLQEDYPSGQPVRITSTDSNGLYRFDDLEAPNVYVIDYAPPGEDPETSQQWALQASDTHELDTVTLGLP